MAFRAIKPLKIISVKPIKAPKMNLGKISFKPGSATKLKPHSIKKF